MQQFIDATLPWGGLAIALLVIVLLWRFVARLFGVIIVSKNQLAIVTKKFRLFGVNRILPDGKLIALNGEAGIQADTLAPGLYMGYWPWQYEIEMREVITIGAGQVGVVEARDGKPITNGRIFASRVESDSFQSAALFLKNGGQRGPQIDILTPGTWRINTQLFTVKLAGAVHIPDKMVGIVTTQDGEPLPTGEIAGREVPGHHSFQDAQAFVDARGNKGLQEQVLLAGSYYLNPDFVTVEVVPMTEVPIGYVGVVIARVGAAPSASEQEDGVQAGHANIVRKGEKGVWDTPYDPGLYPINPDTHVVRLVPTTNIVLQWANTKSAAHDLDKELSPITVRSGDGFTFSLDVGQMIHISPSKASAVIARFGSMENLVTQVLEPLVGNYFRISAQKSDVIEFLRNRSERQSEANQAIVTALAGHHVEAGDTFIGDIVPPAELMATLTARKVAEQQTITYGIEKDAETARQDLTEATALADTRASVVTAQRGVEIAELDAQSAVKKAGGQGQSMIIVADANAHVTKVTGEAEAGKIQAIGTAEASVQTAKVESIGAEPYARIMVATQLAEHGIKLVPEIMVAGGGDAQGSGGIIAALIGTMLKDRLAERPGSASTSEPAPAASIAPATPASADRSTGN